MSSFLRYREVLYIDDNCRQYTTFRTVKISSHVEGVKQMQQTKTYRKYKENSKERFVRYSEGAEMYHISVSKFMQMAKDAKACYKLGQAVLVNLEIFDRYLETFHIVDDDYYKVV